METAPSLAVMVPQFGDSSDFLLWVTHEGLGDKWDVPLSPWKEEYVIACLHLEINWITVAQ